MKLISYNEWSELCEKIKEESNTMDPKTNFECCIMLGILATTVDRNTIPEPKIKTREELLKEIQSPAYAISHTHSQVISAFSSVCPCNKENE